MCIAACSSDDSPASESLVVTDGTSEKMYTPEELEKLGSDQAEFGGVMYKGVQLSELLRDAGFDPGALRAVKASASDGFTVNYEPDLFNLANTLVAYAQVDGPLSEDDGTFRMVLPDQEGKLNPRHLVEIKVFE